MAMHRGSAYEASQNSLLAFASKFNSQSDNIYCCPIIRETFTNDGYFVDVNSGKLFAFDWQIRIRLESFADFKFPTLTEFERKFANIKKTQLMIQSDAKQEHIAVAWAVDFVKEETPHSVVADYGRQQAQRRQTKKFKIYTLSDLGGFRSMVFRAFQNSEYSFKSF